MANSDKPRTGKGAAPAANRGAQSSAGMPGGEVVPSQRRPRRVRASADFLLMMFIVAFSGNPVLTTPEVARYLASIAAVLLGLVLLLKRRPLGSYRGFSILVLFGAITAIQTIHFSSFPAFTVLGLLCRLVIAYSAVVLIRDLAGTYLRVMLVLASLALAIYFTCQAGILLGVDVAAMTRPFALNDSAGSVSWSILIQTFFQDPPDANRNAGMFWEPGALAGYLNLALVFLCLIRTRFTRKGYFIRFAVLSVCLLTTKSTVGYIAYGVVLCMEVIARTRPGGRFNLPGYVSAGLALAVFCVLAANQDFIAPKIENSIQVVTERTANWQTDRIGTIVFDLDYIAARPLTGWGMRNETRLALDPELTDAEENGRGNGMSNFAATFGVVALGVWLVSSYRTLLRLARRRKVIAALGLLVLVISLNGECFLNYPLFLIFFFSFSPKRSWSHFLVWRPPRLLSHAPNSS